MNKPKPKPKPTPTPWGVSDSGPKKQCHIYDRHNGKLIAAMFLENYKDNAAHIVKCVNSHDELVTALKRAYSQILGFLNDGKFERDIIFDAGYIIDALSKAEAKDE